MGCGISRFHLHGEDDDKSDELPKTECSVMSNPGSTHSLLKNGDKIENQIHAKEAFLDKEVNEMDNIDENKGRLIDNDEEADEDEDEDERDGRRISNFDGWVGSPSFREYCVDCKSQDSFKGSEGVEERETKIHAEDKITLSNEEAAMEKRRGRRFTKVFPINRSGVRNFLNVSTCYNPNVSSHTKSSEKKLLYNKFMREQ
ncbi:Uncharacterized protein Adt_21099 [Abeliophyllum distichum]|uniref:Uncharacterized protein n=1 Tax=Abeliophyllum distichum TaxID=126358 RepID=A0ABD1SYJ7_9LAMI